MDPRDRIDYSAIVDRPPLELPGTTRMVVWPVFNIENWDTAKPMPRAILTPPGETLFVPDIPNWSWQEYGMRVGFWRVKAAFDPKGLLNPGKVIPTLQRCAEYGRELVRGGVPKNPAFADLPRF